MEGKNIEVQKSMVPNSIIFHAPNQEEIIRLAKGKFFFKGKEIKDVKKIYERFNEWLKLAEKSK